MKAKYLFIAIAVASLFSACNRDDKAAIETLLDRIEKQREEITLLKLELKRYRSTDAATATP